jgi:Flp pilus assembly protein TadD
MQALQDAVRSHREGRLDEAARGYERILKASPKHADALHLLGLIAHQRGEHGRARALIGKALRSSPQSAIYRNSLGSVLLAIDKPDDARAVLSEAVRRAPSYPEAWNNLGNALTRLGRWREAADAYERAIGLRPGYVEALSNRGQALRAQGRLDEAHGSLKSALGANPRYLSARVNLGLVLDDMGRHEDALAVYDEALALWPEDATLRANRAVLLLRLGRFEEGWREYEWRWRVPGFATLPPAFAEPAWDGADLAGGRLLIYAEQGLGSAIQFARFVPLAAARAGRTIVQCPRPLVRLFRRAWSGTDGSRVEVVEKDAPLPDFDAHAPLMSLPHLLGTTLATIPWPGAYLRVEGGALATWQARLAHLPRPRIGLAWAGNPGHGNDHNRSMPAERLAPLVAAGGASFVSLQVGAGAGVAAFAAGAVFDAAPHLADFAETAAAIAALDRVISVDTAVAHLAGALAAPCWLLLPHAPEWRWLCDRDDSPWYPTLRLFRQRRPGDWDGLVARLGLALADLPAARAAR